MKGIFVLLGLLMASCHQKLPHELPPIYPQPVVAFGFVVYGSIHSDQMYFVPLKDSTGGEISPQDFKSERLGTGFLFSSSTRIQDALALIDTFTISNQLHDHRLVKDMGVTTYSPVRIVYEIDRDALGVFSKDSGIDTITLGRNRYEKSGEKISFVIRFPGADVLKVGRINK